MEFKVGAKESENDAYLQSMEFPSQPKSMVVDFKVTMPSMSEPSKKTNRIHHISKLDQSVTSQKAIILRKYEMPYCQGRKGAWKRQVVGNVL